MFDKKANFCSEIFKKIIDKQMFGYYNGDTLTEHMFVFG